MIRRSTSLVVPSKTNRWGTGSVRACQLIYAKSMIVGRESALITASHSWFEGNPWHVAPPAFLPIAAL
jgi:hypothetical protein